MLELMVLNAFKDKDGLIAGTLEHGYYGTVKASEFITGDALAATVGMTEGFSTNSDTDWLKFSLDYKTLYVSKKPIRYGINWFYLDTLNLIYGTVLVTINDRQYKVRLLKGRGDGLETDISSGYDTEPTWGSEWNRLMYHVTGYDTVDDTYTYPSTKLASEGIVVGDWARFTATELGFMTDGYVNWCQDLAGAQAVTRGYRGVSFIAADYMELPNYFTVPYGWRPCLELVEEV